MTRQLTRVPPCGPGRAALDEGAWLHVVQDPGQRSTLRGIAARAHREQDADPAFRAEFAGRAAVAAERGEGVPAHAGGALPEPQDGWVRRDFTSGSGPDRVPGKAFEVSRTREELRRLIGGARPPQAVLRIGHGRPVAEPPRRAVADLLTSDGATAV